VINVGKYITYQNHLSNIRKLKNVIVEAFFMITVVIEKEIKKECAIAQKYHFHIKKGHLL
jgi:hypothetical protein